MQMGGFPGGSGTKIRHGIHITNRNKLRERTIPTEGPPLAATLVPTFADRVERVVSAENRQWPYS
jgi:hypothetical protein